MAVEVEIPDFQFASFYYPEILEALTLFKRQNVPEHTDESAFDPLTQFLRMQALVDHLNNTLLDLVANEAFLPTARLSESVRNKLRLIDYRLNPASPAQADLVYELAKVFLTSTSVVPANAQAATKKVGDTPAIFYEAANALSISPTNAFTHVLAEEAGVFTDYTTQGNSPTTPGDDWTPWATPAVRDAIYFAHSEALWNTISLFLTTPMSGITGVWEFYDGDYRKTAPTSVASIASTLEVDLTSLLGSQNREGTKIRVMLNETTAFEDVYSTWTGSANIATVGLLGQTSPSTDPTKYTVGSDWSILTVVDASANITTNGKVEYAIPQTLDQNWIKGAVDGKSAYWLRFRIVEVNTPVSPVLQYARMDEGKQYVVRLVTQGRTVNDTPLGSSTGVASQEFQTTRDFFISGSMTVTIEGEEWIQVEDFLSSTPGSKHYVVELGDNDRATIVFGDGVTGRIPPLGVNNISATYRIGGDQNGNVGANTIVVDKSGLSFVNKVFNPRQAVGWAEAEGSTEESLERAKIAGPASLRTKDVALGPSDLIQLTIAFEDEAGARPYARARAFEEGFGPKTVELTVVAKGGGLASAEQLAALDLYFNGDQFTQPPVEKHFVANQEVTSVNYTPKPIDVVATVHGDVTEEEVLNRLTQIIQPEAVKADGVTWEWEFGAEVPSSRISHEIFETDDSITKVILTTPAAPVPLLPRELPVLGTVSITIVAP